MSEPTPQSIHESEMEILGLKVRVSVLDDGRRIIHADDFEALMQKAFGELTEILSDPDFAVPELESGS